MTRAVARPVVGLVIGAALALAPGRADACLYAWQYRVFPLGVFPSVSGGHGLLAVVFDVHRSSDELFENVTWEGTARFAVLAPDGEPLRTLAESDIVEPEGPLPTQRATLAAAWIMAAALPGFEPLPPPTVHACGFQSDCGPVSLRIEEGGEPVVLLDGRLDRQRDVHVASPVFDTLGWQLALDDEPREERRRQARAYFREAVRGFDLNTVRVYRRGGQRLVVANLASGDERAAGPGPTRLEADGCPSLPACFYPEPTPHHGTSFDVIVRE